MKNLLLLIMLSLNICVSAQNQDSSDFYYKLGLQEKNEGHNLVASQAFEKAIKFDPLNAKAYLENAYVNKEMKKTEAAKFNFSKVHTLQPDNKTVIKELMDIYYNYRQLNKATELALKCKECPGADRIIGISYYRQEDYPKAEKALLAALSKDKQDAELTYTLARTYLDMEEYVKAVPFYEKAIVLDKTKNMWMYELGILYFNLNNYKAAVASLLNAATNGYVANNDFNENLGYAMLFSGEFDKGEQLLLNVLAKKPGSTDILRDMAEVMYKQKQYDRSLSYCQKLLDINKNDANALYQAGLNFQKKGNKDKGQQLCDRAIEMNPSLASLRQEKKMPGM